MQAFTNLLNMVLPSRAPVAPEKVNNPECKLEDLVKCLQAPGKSPAFFILNPKVTTTGVDSFKIEGLPRSNIFGPWRFCADAVEIDVKLLPGNELKVTQVFTTDQRTNPSWQPQLKQDFSVKAKVGAEVRDPLDMARYMQYQLEDALNGGFAKLVNHSHLITALGFNSAQKSAEWRLCSIADSEGKSEVAIQARVQAKFEGVASPAEAPLEAGPFVRVKSRPEGDKTSPYVLEIMSADRRQSWTQPSPLIEIGWSIGQWGRDEVSASAREEIARLKQQSVAHQIITGQVEIAQQSANSIALKEYQGRFDHKFLASLLAPQNQAVQNNPNYVALPTDREREQIRPINAATAERGKTADRINVERAIDRALIPRGHAGLYGLHLTGEVRCGDDAFMNQLNFKREVIIALNLNKPDPQTHAEQLNAEIKAASNLAAAHLKLGGQLLLLQAQIPKEMQLGFAYEKDTRDTSFRTMQLEWQPLNLDGSKAVFKIETSGQDYMLNIHVQRGAAEYKVGLNPAQTSDLLWGYDNHEVRQIVSYVLDLLEVKPKVVSAPAATRK